MAIGILEIVTGVVVLLIGWSGLWFRTTGYISKREAATVGVSFFFLAMGVILMHWGLARVDPILLETAKATASESGAA